MCAATAAVAAETQSTRIAVPPFERVVLDNGLTLLLMERREIAFTSPPPDVGIAPHGAKP